MKKKSVMAIIPARGGSKGIPRKNIKPLGGRPLLYYTVDAAKKSDIFDKIIVSTDDAEIEKVSIKYGAHVVKRPGRISRDTSSTEQAVIHALWWLKKKEKYIPDVIILLQATSPLRTAPDIRAAYRKFREKNLDSLLSVTRNKAFIWKAKKDKFVPVNYDYKSRPRRQDIKNQFRENGAIYITKNKTYKKSRNRLGGSIGYYIMNEERSMEVDTMLDFEAIRCFLKKSSNFKKGACNEL